jgi:hypothetical protein
MPSDRIHGKAARDFREEMKSIWKPINQACGLCGQATIDWDAPANEPDAFELDHILTVSARPDLQLDPANARPTHHRCNRSRGARSARPPVGITSEAW